MEEKKSRKSILQAEETAANSPLRRSSRISVHSPAPATITTRRTSQTLVEHSDSTKPSKTRRASLSQENKEKDEKVESKPALRSRAASVTKEENDKKTEPAKTRGRRSSVQSEPLEKEEEKKQPITRRRRSAVEEQPVPHTVRTRRTSAIEQGTDEEELLKKSGRTRKGSTKEEETKEEPVKRTLRARSSSITKKEETPIITETKKTATRGRRLSTDKLDDDPEPKVSKVSAVKLKRRSSISEVTVNLVPVEEEEPELYESANSRSDSNPVELTPIKKKKTEQSKSDLDLSIINESITEEATVAESPPKKKQLPTWRSPKKSPNALVETAVETISPRKSPRLNKETFSNDIKKLDFEDAVSADSPETISTIKHSEILEKEIISSSKTNEDTQTPTSHISMGSDGSFQFHLSLSIPSTRGSQSQDESIEEVDADLNSSKNSEGSDKENIAKNLTNDVNVSTVRAEKRQTLDSLAVINANSSLKEINTQQEVLVARVSNVFKPMMKEHSFIEPMEVDIIPSDNELVTSTSGNKLDETDTENIPQSVSTPILKENNIIFKKNTLTETINSSPSIYVDDSFKLCLSDDSNEEELTEESTEAVGKTMVQGSQNIESDFEIDVCSVQCKDNEVKLNRGTENNPVFANSFVNSEEIASTHDKEIPLINLNSNQGLNPGKKGDLTEKENMEVEEVTLVTTTQSPRPQTSHILEADATLPKFSPKIESPLLKNFDKIDKNETTTSHNSENLEQKLEEETCNQQNSENNKDESRLSKLKRSLPMPEGIHTELVLDSDEEQGNGIEDGKPNRKSFSPRRISESPRLENRDIAKDIYVFQADSLEPGNVKSPLQKSESPQPTSLEGHLIRELDSELQKNREANCDRRGSRKSSSLQTLQAKPAEEIELEAKNTKEIDTGIMKSLENSSNSKGLQEEQATVEVEPDRKTFTKRENLRKRSPRNSKSPQPLQLIGQVIQKEIMEAEKLSDIDEDIRNPSRKSNLCEDLHLQKELTQEADTQLKETADSIRYIEKSSRKSRSPQLLKVDEQVTQEVDSETENLQQSDRNNQKPAKKSKSPESLQLEEQIIEETDTQFEEITEYEKLTKRLSRKSKSPQAQEALASDELKEIREIDRDNKRLPRKSLSPGSSSLGQITEEIDTQNKETSESDTITQKSKSPQGLKLKSKKLESPEISQLEEQVSQDVSAELNNATGSRIKRSSSKSKSPQPLYLEVHVGQEVDTKKAEDLDRDIRKSISELKNPENPHLKEPVNQELDTQNKNNTGTERNIRRSLRKSKSPQPHQLEIQVNQEVDTQHKNKTETDKNIRRSSRKSKSPQNQMKVQVNQKVDTQHENSRKSKSPQPQQLEILVTRKSKSLENVQLDKQVTQEGYVAYENTKSEINIKLSEKSPQSPLLEGQESEGVNIDTKEAGEIDNAVRKSLIKIRSPEQPLEQEGTREVVAELKNTPKRNGNKSCLLSNISLQPRQLEIPAQEEDKQLDEIVVDLEETPQLSLILVQQEATKNVNEAPQMKLVATVDRPAEELSKPNIIVTSDDQTKINEDERLIDSTSSENLPSSCIGDNFVNNEFSEMENDFHDEIQNHLENQQEDLRDNTSRNTNQVSSLQERELQLENCNEESVKKSPGEQKSLKDQSTSSQTTGSNTKKKSTKERVKHKKVSVSESLRKINKDTSNKRTVFSNNTLKVTMESETISQNNKVQIAPKVKASSLPKSKLDNLETFANSKLDEYLSKKISEMEDNSFEEEEEEEDNEFICGMAEEGEEDTPSEGSNDIIDEGESINLTETETDSDDYDSNDSFICNDVEEKLLPGEEYDLNIEDCDKTQKKSKKSRIINIDDCEDSIISIKRKPFPVVEKKKKSRIIAISDSSDEESEIINIKDDTKATSKILQKEEIFNKSSEDAIEVTDDEEVLIIEEQSTFNTSNADPEMCTSNKEIYNSPGARKTNRKSSITIHENINVLDIKDAALSERIHVLVDSFCTTINKGEISMNLSLEYADKDSSEGSTKDCKMAIDDTKNKFLLPKNFSCPKEETAEEFNTKISKPLKKKLKAQQHKKNNSSISDSSEDVKIGQSKRLSVTLDNVEQPDAIEKNAPKKRRLSKSLENLNTRNDKSNKKKKILNSKKKTVSKTNILKNTKAKKPATALVDELRTQTFSIMNQLITDVKNRPLRSLKPSKTIPDLDSCWTTEVADVKPSTTVISRKEQIEFKSGKVHPKDFRNQMLYDPSRVRRIETKMLLKKKGPYL